MNFEVSGREGPALSLSLSLSDTSGKEGNQGSH